MQVGAVVRLGPGAPGAAIARYHAVREMARAIEDAGLDALWVYDHLLYRWPGQPTDGIWECWTTLSALAEATHRVQLGTLVMCTAFRNPALLAKMAATLDEVSDGRLILGIGAGWHQPEFDAFGYPFDRRAGRFEEAVQIIRPLLREGRVNFRGTFSSAPDCEIIPRGPRPDGPPLLIAGARPRMLRLTARYADAWNTAWHSTPETAAPALEHMRAACAEEGRDPATLTLTAGIAMAFPELGPLDEQRRYLTGSDEEIAAGLRGYAALGVSQVMVDLTPYTVAAIARLGRVAELSRT